MVCTYTASNYGRAEELADDFEHVNNALLGSGGIWCIYASKNWNFLCGMCAFMRMDGQVNL